VSVNRQSPKFLEARESLPPELRPIYDRLVDEYAYYTALHYGQGYVAYRVIASLVKSGWRVVEGSSDE
jgi:hypothetical protein